MNTPAALDHVNGVGEIACLLAMATDLADRANNENDVAAGWRLAALLRAAKARAEELHDSLGAALLQEGGAA